MAARAPANVQVPTGEALRVLLRLRPLRWALDFAFDWAIIVAVVWGFGWIGSWWLFPVAALLIGARLHALGLLAHDATHRCFTKKRWLNELAEVFTAWPLLVKIEGGYRQWHFQHHRTLGTADDPELVYRHDPVYKAPVSQAKVVRMFFTDLFGFGALDLLKFSAQVFPKRPIQFLGPALAWALFALVCFFYDAMWVFGLMLGSLLTGFWAVFRIRTWSEHVGVVPNGLGTSHRFHAGPIARFLFFPHNTYCHFEHHVCAQVPYYNLPELRRQCVGPEVVSVGQMLRNLAMLQNPASAEEHSALPGNAIAS